MSGAVELEAELRAGLDERWDGPSPHRQMLAWLQNNAYLRYRAADLIATLRSDNERLGRELDEARRSPDCTNALACPRVINFARAHTKEFKRAQAAEAERDTLLAQVEMMTGVLKRIANLSGTAGGEFIKNENGFRHERGVFANEIARAALTKEPS